MIKGDSVFSSPSIGFVVLVNVVKCFIDSSASAVVSPFFAVVDLSVSDTLDYEMLTYSLLEK